MTASDSPVIDVRQRGAVRWLHLNRPQQRNALDRALIDALDEQITQAEEDPATSAVAVAGNGPSFSAGGDFREFLALHDAGINPVEFLQDVSACFSRIEASPVPWLAVLHGHAIAGGLELALACDVVVAARGTLIGDGHVNHHLLPAGGSSVRLPRAVGRPTARWLLLTGQLVPVEELHATGWLHAVVSETELGATADTIAEGLAARAGNAGSALKQLLARIEGVPADNALRLELEAFAENWRTGAPADALRDFLDRRPTAATEAPR